MALAVRRMKIIGKREAGDQVPNDSEDGEAVPHVALDLREIVEADKKRDRAVGATAGSTLVIPEEGSPEYGAIIVETFELEA